MKSYRLKQQNIMQIPGDEDSISMEELSNMPDNGIDYINCLNILEVVDDPIQTLNVIESKLRLSGECYIIGVNINSICEYYLDNIINIELFNQAIKYSKRFYDITTLVNLIEGTFEIKSIKTYGIYYHLIIQRKGLS